jgi:hypothetical protein
MRGWIRPDKFPTVSGKPTVDDWWDFFNSLSRKMDINVRGAAYRDWRFLESYQLGAIEDCVAAESLHPRPSGGK